jgi:hypothetical protein
MESLVTTCLAAWSRSLHPENGEQPARRQHAGKLAEHGRLVGRKV